MVKFGKTGKLQFDDNRNHDMVTVMDAHSNLHEGRKFVCRQCRQNSVVKTVRRLGDWSVEEFLGCAFCQSPVREPGNTKTDSPGDNAEKQNKLAFFLKADEADIETPELKERKRDAIFGDRANACFCRDCRHFLKHPFVARCMLWNRPTEPMKDCPKFTPAKPPEND